MLFFLDFVVIALYVGVMIFVAWYFRKRNIRSLKDFFAGGEDSPWWLLGISMVATTFAADTPLAVTGIVASDGISGNWIWWNLMVSGLITVFIYARLWKRAGILTDVEFIDIRYSGKPARFLRGFRALYLAFPINCIILGWVTVGMAKILTVLLGAPMWSLIIGIYLITGIYIMFSGIWGVLVTDALQFTVAIVGSIIFAVLAVNHVGGLSEIPVKLEAMYPNSDSIMAFIPSASDAVWASFLIWVSMTWWASWYPGAEPGGGGYVVQRLISAKSERDAVGASLFFNVAHYALRPWPWILVALVAMIVFPNLDDKETGYPLLMLEILPPGLLGLMLVVFLAAFVSTVSTHVNWGASYVVNDFYKPFIKQKEEFSDEETADRHYVGVAKMLTLVIMGVAIAVSYFFDSVKGGWEVLLSLGAGIGPVYFLRWLWWRINAWSEISAMVAALIGSIVLANLDIASMGIVLALNTAFASVVWIVVTMLTSPEDEITLSTFAARVSPPGPGWRAFQKTEEISLSPMIVRVVLGVVMLIGFLFGMHQLFLGSTGLSIAILMLATAIGFWLLKTVEAEVSS